VLADHAAGAVQQAQLREEAAVRLRRLELLQRVSAVVNAGDDLDTMLTRVLQETAAHIASTGGQIALVDDQRQFVRGRVGVNLPSGLAEATVRRLYPASHPEEDVYALAVRTGEQLVFDSDHPALHRAADQRFHGADGQRVLTVIRHGTEVIGVLLFLWQQQRPPTADDLALLRLVAEQLGGAIMRTRLAEAETSTREQLLAALQASVTMVMTYDLTGRLTRVQGASQALLGWDAEAMIGRSLEEFISPAEYARFHQRIAERARGDRGVLQRDMFFRHRLGHAVQLLISVGPHMQGDRVVGGAGAVTDHSHIRRLQEERDAALAAHARAEGAMRTGQSVVHELASPLGTALGIAELLARDPCLPPGAADDLQLLRTQVLRAGELLHRFGRIVRYEEIATPSGPQLDLERSSPET
jgi:PAS domain S-box-containing protein